MPHPFALLAKSWELRMLPADVTSGTYDLEDLNPGLGGNLIEGKVAPDKTFGHLTYGCLTCCGYTLYLSPLPDCSVYPDAQRGSADSRSPEAVKNEVNRLFSKALDAMEYTLPSGVKATTWTGW